MSHSVAINALYKDAASKWADHYLKSFNTAGASLAAAAVKIAVSNEPLLAREDVTAVELPEGGLNTESAKKEMSFGERVALGRFASRDFNLTRAALDLVLMVSANPGDISMLVAVIQYVVQSKPLSDDKLITARWLAGNVFHEGAPTEHINEQHWERQKLGSLGIDESIVGEQSGNLVDIAGAFVPMTDEELEYITAPSTKSV